MNVHILEAAWRDFGDRLRAIRQKVFVEEQNVPQDEEWDGLDERAWHFLAVDEAGRYIGCARLLESGQIGRMAVLKDFRKSGIGGELLEEAVRKAESLGLTEVFLHAQTHAQYFYADHDFLAEGDEFAEAGIAHITMRRQLAIPFTGEVTPVKVPEQIETPQQETSGTFFEGEAQVAAALVEGINQARRHLVIYSELLDPTYFEDERVVTAVSEFARRSRTAEIRILIRSSSIIQSRGHRLVELIKRLMSKIQIRLVHPDDDAPESCFASWDGEGYWRLPDDRTPAGVMRTEDPVRARKLQDTFDILWRRAKVDPNLRVLRI